MMCYLLISSESANWQNKNNLCFQNLLEAEKFVRKKREERWYPK